MKTIKIFLISAFAGLICFSCWKKSSQPSLKISSKMEVPEWARLEREILKENVSLMEVFAEKYINPVTGAMEVVEHFGGEDGPDDAMENFNNWPLIYAMGAPQRSLDLFRHVWEGHLKQYSDLKMLDREFITAFDWEHNGEGYQAFLMLPLADPYDPKTRERVIRYANFYTGRDSSISNYDPKHKIIKSILNGSHGSKLDATHQYWSGKEGESYFSTSGDWTRVKGDVPLNLISTSLAANAYFLTGDQHYRDWVLEYAGAWRDRTLANNGWVPSIIGLNGKIGEGWDGKWYGGLMGWNWVFGGWSVLGRGVRIGFMNAAFLDGKEFLDVLREQGKRLSETSGDTSSGRRFINRYGDKGPYGFTDGPSVEGMYSDIYFHTLDKKDLEVLYSVSSKDVTERSKSPYWNFEYQNGRYEGGNELAWFNYLGGNDPGYPERVLREAVEVISYKKQAILEDNTPIDKRLADTPHELRVSIDAPLGAVGGAAGAMVNLSMGGITPLWCGGLLRAELRYFDPAGKRPGLPQDVAALVTGIDPEFVKVTLVNLNQDESRKIIVQTGAYGENLCEKVLSGKKTIQVDSKSFEVSIDAGSGGELTIYRKRFASQPTFRFPWQE